MKRRYGPLCLVVFLGGLEDVEEDVDKGECRFF